MAAFINSFFKSEGRFTPLSYIIIVNIAVWALTAVVAVCGYFFDTPTEWIHQWLSFPADYKEIPSRFWTALTYMATQYSFLHLLFNMLWLYWFGNILLSSAPQRALLFLYITGGLAGAAIFSFSSALTGQTAGYLCGSSASVLAIVTATSILHANMKMRMMLIGEVKLKWIGVVCILLTFLGEGNGAAHAGGVGIGALYGLLDLHGIELSRYFRLRHKISTLRKEIKEAVAKPQEPPVLHRWADNVSDPFENRLNDSRRLDDLLDKIRISGYDSLSSAEKRELNAISSRLNP